MLAVTLAPAEIWRAPANDAVYHGFDANLMYANGGSTGQVQFSRDSVDITAPPTAQPSINLATTLVPNMTASVDVLISENPDADVPFRIGVWSPWTSSGRFVVFGPDPGNLITVETIEKGSAGTTLVDGDVVDSTILGAYQLGSRYAVDFIVDRTHGRITTAVTPGGGTRVESVLSSGQAPTLFSNAQLSLTGSASAGEGTSHIVLQNFTLTLPHQRWWAVRIDDPIEKFLVVALALLGLVATAVAIAAATPTLRGRVARLRPRLPRPGRAAVVVSGAVALYLVGNALLFPLGGHPFDARDEELYAYVTNTHGLTQLYYLPNFVSLATIWSGVPYVEAAFPYGPVLGYLNAAIGWLSSQLFAGGSAFRLDDVRLLYLIKSVNVMFGLADAALIYVILRQIRVDRRWSLVAAALFLFNPAVWFSMSVWGQTHVISLFFVLAAVLLAEKQLPMWAWLALVAALMTRPQMIVFGLLLGIVFLRKFSVRQNVWALSWTVVIVFLLLLPFTLMTSPSLPIDVILNNFRIQEAGGNQAQLSTVSQDAYSVWPLVTYALHGASGLSRAFTPSSAYVFGNVTYQRLGLILTVLAVLAVSAALLLRGHRTLDAGGYLPLVALGMCSFLMLLTGIVATHFLLALPFLLLCRRWMGNIAFFYVAAIWTVTTLVPMYGDMGAVISARDYPLLAPANNAVTKLFVQLYSWDRLITVSIVANICALIWLAFTTFRRTPVQLHA